MYKYELTGLLYEHVHMYKYEFAWRS